MCTVQNSFRGLLRDGSLEERVATFDLPASGQKMQPFDGMGGIAVHELISGYAAGPPAPPPPFRFPSRLPLAVVTLRCIAMCRLISGYAAGPPARSLPTPPHPTTHPALDCPQLAVQCSS